MTQDSGTLQRIVLALPRRVGRQFDLQKTVSARFTPRLWGSKLIEQDSFEGIATEWLRRHFSIDPAPQRMSGIFRQVLRSCNPSKVPGLTPSQVNALYRAKLMCCPQVQVEISPIDHLRAALSQYSPSDGDIAADLHWTEEPQILKGLSLLNSSGSPSNIDRQTFEALFDPSATVDPSSLEQLFAYLNVSGVAATEDLQLLSASSKQAFTTEAALQKIVELGQKPDGLGQAKIQLGSLANSIAHDILHLEPGQRHLIFGGCAGRSPHLENIQTGSQIIDQLPLFLSGNGAEEISKLLADKITSCIRGTIPSEISQPFQTTLQNALQKGVVSYLFPRLRESLYKDRSLAERLVRIPAELIRQGLVLGADSLEAYTGELIAAQFSEFLTRDEIFDLYAAAKNGNLQEFIQTKLKLFLKKHTNTIRTQILSQISKITNSLPPYIPAIVHMKGHGDLGMPQQPIWYEVERQQDGKFSFYVYAVGSVVMHYFPSSLGLQEKTVYQVPLCYKDLTSDQLDDEFFHSLLFCHIGALLDPAQSPFLSDIFGGLLASFDCSSANLSDQPHALSCTAANKNGLEALFHTYLRHRLKLGSQEEETQFQFRLRTKALIDAWAQFKDSPQMHPVLKKAAQQLINEALELFKQKLISRNALKCLYATTTEILSSIPEPKPPSQNKAVAFPPEVMQHIHLLFRAPSDDFVQPIKELLIGAVGPQIEKPLNEAIATLNLPPDQPPSLASITGRAKELISMCFTIYFGISFSDIQNPTFWSYLRGAFLASRIFLAILYPTVGTTVNLIFVISMVAREVLTTLAFYFLPEPTRLFFKWKNRLIGKTFAALFLRGERLVSFQVTVEHLRQYVTRTGVLSFDLPPLHIPPLSRKVEWVSPPLPPIPKLRLPILPNPLVSQKQEITAQNCAPMMQDWLRRIDALTAPFKDTVSIFLNEQMKSLPVPRPGQLGDCWSHVADVYGALETVSEVALLLYRATAYSSFPTSIRKTETTINLFKAFAIVDTLARRCPESRLQGFKVNAWSLASWSQDILLQIFDESSRKDLYQLLEYFDIKPEEDAWITSEEIRLFREVEKTLFMSSYDEPGGTQRYLAQFVADPHMAPKFEAMGIPPEAQDTERFAALHVDEPLDRHTPPQLQALFSEHGLNRRMGLLPESFHLLRLTHLLANQAICRDHREIISFEDLRIFSIFAPLANIKDRDNHVRKLVSWTGYFPKGEQSVLDKIPRARFVEVENTGRPTSIRPHQYFSKPWSSYATATSCPLGRLRIENLQKILTNFHSMPRRTQNAILEDPSSFCHLRERDSPSRLFQTLSYLFPHRITNVLNCELSDFPVRERRLFEMSKVDSFDEPVRILSYFSQHMSHFASIDFAMMFKVLLLQEHLLSSYLKTHPEFGHTLGDFFCRALTFLRPIAKDSVLFMLLETTIFARVIATSANPACYASFPNLRTTFLELIHSHSRKEIGLQLIGIPHHFIDPERATPEEIDQAVYDISIGWVGFSEKYSPAGKEKSLFEIEIRNLHNDTYHKWRPIIQSRLEADKALRNSVLNQVAELLALPGRGKDLQWEGTFPIFQSGIFTIELFCNQNMKREVNIKPLISSSLREIYGTSDIPEFHLYTDGCWSVFGENVRIELIQLPGEPIHRLAFYKEHLGQDYRWVKMDTPEPHRTCWIGKPRENGKIPMLVLDKGKLSELCLLKERDGVGDFVKGKTFDISPMPVEEHGHDHFLIDLPNEPHGLSLLSWFQPLSKIRALRSAEPPHALSRIEFSCMDFAFNLQQVGGSTRAVGEGAVCGLMIAENQRREDLYPSLSGYSRYLLLEKPDGGHKVILPSNTLRSAAVSWLLKNIASLSSSQLMDLHLDHALDTSTSKYYMYDFDARGRLTSSNPEGMAHLLFYHLAQGAMDCVRRDLIQLEGLGRRTPLPSNVHALFNHLHCAAASWQDPEIRRLSLRLAALSAENAAVQADKPLFIKAGPNLLPWIAIQANYAADLQDTTPPPRFSLSEEQELFILRQLAEAAKTYINDYPEMERFKRLGFLDVLAEMFLLLPIVADRYFFLRQKYAADGEEETVSLKGLFRSWLLGTSHPHLISSPSTEKPPILKAISSILIPKKRMGGAFNLSKFSSLDLVAARWQDIPVLSSEITTASLSSYIHLYYQFAMGEIPSGLSFADLDLFKAKRRKFRRSLLLLRCRSFGPSLDSWLSAFHEMFEGAGRRMFPSTKNLCEVLKAVQEYENRPLSQRERKKHEMSIETLEKCLMSALRQATFFSVDNVDILKEFAKSCIPGVVKNGAFHLAFSLLQLPLTSFWFQSARLAYSGVSAIQGEVGRCSAANEARALLRDPPSPQPYTLPCEEILVEDQSMADALYQLFITHFNTVDVGAGQLQEQVLPFDAGSDGRVMQRYFGRLNTSLDDFYDRPPLDQTRFAPENVDHFHRFGLELLQAAETLEKSLDPLRQQIVAFSKVERRPNQPDEEIISQLVSSARQAHIAIDCDVYFEELVQAFGRQDREWVNQHTTLREMDIGPLSQMIYRYLLRSTRLDQIKRCYQIWEAASLSGPFPDPSEPFSDPKVKILFSQLSFEVIRTRAYPLDDPATAKFARANLLFEYVTKTMLWEKQVSQLQKMLANAGDHLVSELIMGSGKTFYSMPMTSFYAADRSQTICNIFPDALAYECIDDMAHKAHLLGQRANAASFSRKKDLNANYLWAHLRVYMRAIHRGEQLNGRKKDFQCLELRFIEAISIYLDAENKPDTLHLFYFMKILKLLRTKVRGNIDEAHHSFRHKDELNFPLGPKKKVKETYVKTTMACTMALSSCIPPNTHVDPEIYDTQFRPQFAERMSRHKPFDIAPEQQSIFAHYLSHKEAAVPDFVLNHPKRGEIDLVKGFVTIIARETLQRKIFTDYGPLLLDPDDELSIPDPDDEFARPYKGNMNPDKNSNIKNPYEAVFKTCWMFLFTRLSKRQVKTFVAHLYELAKNESLRDMIPFDQTTIARHFHTWCEGRYKLSEFEQNPSEETLLEVIDLLNKNDLAVLTYARQFPITRIKYYCLNTGSNSQSFASMFSSFYSCTASPNRDGTFPTGTQVLWDTGTAGEFVDFVCNNCKEPEFVQPIKALNAQGSLENILTRFFSAEDSKARAIIDTGALFYGLTTLQVATIIRKFIIETRPDIDGVVFFDEDQTKVIWEKNGDKPIPLEQSSIPLERRITYFDHYHTFGADIKQMIGARGIVTMEATTPLDSLSQGGGRMRGLKTSDQSLCFVYPERIKPLLNPNGAVTIRDVIHFTEKNEAASQPTENHLSAWQQIDNVARRAALDKMIFAFSVPEMLKFFKAFRDLFITQTLDDPTALYGTPQVDVPFNEALQAYKDKTFSMLSSSGMFSGEEVQQIKDQLEGIGTEADIYPDRVPTSLDDLGAAQEILQDQDQDQTQQMEQQQNQNLQQDQCVENCAPPKQTTPFRNKPAEWTSNVDYFSDLGWLKCRLFNAQIDHSQVTIYHVSESLSRAAFTAPISDAFKGRMWWTNNFLGVLDKGPCGELCHPLESLKPILELLVIRIAPNNGPPFIFSGAIDQYDAAHWRRLFEMDRGRGIVNPHIQIGLFDLGLQTIVDTGGNRLTDADLFSNNQFSVDLIRWKFLAGHANFLMGKNGERDTQLITQCREWTSAQDLGLLRRVFVRTNRRCGVGTLSGSNFSPFLQPAQDLISIDCS